MLPVPHLHDEVAAPFSAGIASWSCVFCLFLLPALAPRIKGGLIDMNFQVELWLFISSGGSSIYDDLFNGFYFTMFIY